YCAQGGLLCDTQSFVIALFINGGVLNPQDLDRGLHPPNGFLQADITFLFLTGLVASRTARCLLGFTNRGGEDFVIDSIEGSFHFPQDYGFHLQNLSILPLNSVVHPQHEASFSYSFLVAGALGGRQLSLVITLSYHRDQESYKEAVFNKTLMVTESPDEFDGETFFLYVFLGALVILLLIGVHQLLDTRRRRHTPAVMEEQGTGNLSNVNLSWLPPETLKQINKTPPKRSSRKRGLRRGDKSSH
uniref:Translocon-associated protein subunit alpha n=1 Tax=Eptatretus burgeri TaxID=7764 RepID=A0A8C4NCC8_EPTBU